MNENEEHQPERVGHDMTLAALDLLARVVASKPSAFGRLHPLAVDDTGGGAGLTSFEVSRAQDQDVVDRVPQTAVPPPVEVALHRRTWGKILGQHAPLAAAGGDVEDGVHHRSQLRPAWPSTRLGWWQERRDHTPFQIRHVARISGRLTSMLVTTTRVPRHLILQLLVGRKNHNPWKSLKPFWARLSGAWMASSAIQVMGRGAPS